MGLNFVQMIVRGVTGNFQSLVQSWIGGFAQLVMVCARFQLLLEQISLVGEGSLQQIPEKNARLLGIACLVVVEGDDRQVSFASQLGEGLLELSWIGVGEISRLPKRVEAAGLRRVVPFLDQLRMAGADKGLFISAGKQHRPGD